MCLNLNLFGLVPRIAFKDIKCYKVVSKTEYASGLIVYRTPFVADRINIGDTYTSKFERRGLTIEKGLHSFKSIKGTSILIGPRKDDHAEIIECVIPKWSIYYKGKFWSRISYASNKLTYLKLVK